ncbi:MAG: penicillin-insensitive murein endopeptidase [Polyangiales bacterium]
MRGPHPPRAALFGALIFAALSFGCAHLRVGEVEELAGSRGKPSGGWLTRGAHLGPRGAGFEALRSDAQGGQLWGVPRLVAAVRRVARALAPRHGGTPLRVGDLSARRGGQIPRHRSHRSGRDVDLLFYARDEATGEAVPAPDFVRYDRALRSLRRPSPLRFDVERNWNLVEALLRDTQAGVARIFVADWLRRALLEHARAHGKAAWVVERASRVLLQPGDSLPHDDHFHVRVACTASERSLGCVDGTPVWSWMIKDWEKGDAVSNDDEALLDLMEPLPFGALHGPPDPGRGSARVCAPPRAIALWSAPPEPVCR